jgi:hypothetical protein
MSIIEREHPPEVVRGHAPAHPATLDELNFERRKPVRWFSPSTLARAGAKVVLSLVLGEYLDKRELQQSLASSLPRVHCATDEMWIDFVADTADGFDASYSVAWCVSQRSINVDGRDLPRGDLLILGGDQVYPYATVQEYEDRFRGALSRATDHDAGEPFADLNSANQCRVAGLSAVAGWWASTATSRYAKPSSPCSITRSFNAANCTRSGT